MDMAQYTEQELARLKLGYIIRERPAGDGDDGAASRRRELEHGRQQARRETFGDLGFV